MRSRNITILIGFNIAHYSTFYQPTLVENSHFCLLIYPHQKLKVCALHLYQVFYETKVSITLWCQLHSTYYTAVWIKNHLKITSEIKSSHYEKYRWFTKESHHVKLTLGRMHCTYGGMPNGISRAKATLNSEKWGMNP